MEAKSMSAQVFSVVDAMDLDALGALFAEDATLVFGNSSPLSGPQQIRAGIAEFYASIAGLHHTIANEWTVGADTIVEASVTYHRHDGQEVTLPAVTIWHQSPTGKLDSYRVFVDLAPVYT